MGVEAPYRLKSLELHIERVHGSARGLSSTEVAVFDELVAAIVDDIADAWSPRTVVEPSGTLDREQWARAVERSRGWIPDLSALDF